MKRIFLVALVFSLSSFAKDYMTNPDVASFVNEVSSRYHIKKESVITLFSDVVIQERPLRFFRPKKPKKRTPQEIENLKKRYPYYGAWDRYVKLKITPLRIKQGIAFIQKHKQIFDEVEKKYGIPKEYIAAIVGIETVYGANIGKYPVFDTLVTLAFEKNRRNRFFKKELEKFLHLVYSQNIDPKNVFGSYAGAIGLGQFMPSNYEAYGVDFDGDGRVMLQKADDAIASIANYLKKNGWRKGEPVATRASYEGMRFKGYKTGYKKTYDAQKLVGIAPKDKEWKYDGKVRLIKLNRKHFDELWYGTKNFFVITRYNHSAYYAMAVHQLAQKIIKGLMNED